MVVIIKTQYQFLCSQAKSAVFEVIKLTVKLRVFPERLSQTDTLMQYLELFARIEQS